MAFSYRVVSILPNSSWPLWRQKDVDTAELGIVDEWNHERGQIFGRETVGWGWFLQGLLTTDIGDL